MIFLYIHDTIITDDSFFLNRKKRKKWRICIMITIPSGANYDKIGRAGMLNVRHISYTSVQGGWGHRDRFLTEKELIFVTGGSVHLLVNGERFDVGENEYLLLPEYCAISAPRRSRSPCSFYSVAFDGSMGILEDRMKVKFRLTGNILFAYELLKRMLDLYDINKSEHAECDALFLSFLYEIASAREQPGEEGFDTQRVLDYIHDHLNLPLEIDDLCREFHYSRDFLSKVFRSRYDISIKRYINQVKVNAARQLLTTSRMSVEQVGNAIGFDDVQLFYKFFRYHTGMTPSAFRKQNS